MFCTKCGEEIPADYKFCTHCGAPIGSPTGGADAPPPPEGDQPTQVRTFPAPIVGVPEPQPRGFKLRYILLIAAAAVLVIAGGTTAGLLLVRHSHQPNTDVAAAAGGTETTLDDSLQSTTSAASETTIQSENVSAFVAGLQGVSRLLQEDDLLIAKPNLATQINDTIPNVPYSVDTQLQEMLDSLKSADADLGRYEVPISYSTASARLAEAVSNMEQRITATLNGVQAARNSGAASAGDIYFDQGRQYRDAYQEAFQQYQAALP